MVSLLEKGTGLIYRKREVYDDYDRLSWEMDPQGYINHYAHDVATGAMVRSIQDVDTGEVGGVPDGWETPLGGGLNLVIDYNFYNYDGLYQVKGAARGDLNINRTAIGGVPKRQEGFSYDPTGNWTRYTSAIDGVEDLDQSRVNNQDNQIVQIDGSGVGVAHDKAGNTTKMPPDASGEWDESYNLIWNAWNRLVTVKDDSETPVEVAANSTLSWDSENRLISVVRPDAKVVTYTYDPAGRKIRKDFDGTTTHHLHDGWNLIGEYDDAWAAQKTWVWGSGWGGAWGGARGFLGSRLRGRSGKLLQVFDDHPRC